MRLPLPRLHINWKVAGIVLSTFTPLATYLLANREALRDRHAWWILAIGSIGVVGAVLCPQMIRLAQAERASDGARVQAIAIGEVTP